MALELRATPIAGCFEVIARVMHDERGSFTRLLSEPDLLELGLEFRTSEANIATTVHPGTVRGLHLQQAPYGEAKWVRCAVGRAFDVAVDLRADSPTFGTWFGTEISDTNGVGLLVPRGCAHGYQTLAPQTTLAYAADAPYAPTAEIIVSPLHEQLAIAWPLPPERLSAKDADADTTAALPEIRDIRA